MTRIEDSRQRTRQDWGRVGKGSRSESCVCRSCWKQESSQWVQMACSVEINWGRGRLGNSLKVARVLDRSWLEVWSQSSLSRCYLKNLLVTFYFQLLCLIVWKILFLFCIKWAKNMFVLQELMEVHVLALRALNSRWFTSVALWLFLQLMDIWNNVFGEMYLWGISLVKRSHFWYRPVTVS